jgi:hypothetical protein
MADKLAPIVVRIAVTPEEWRAVRTIALERNESAAETVAHALRATYNLNGEPKS